MVKCLFILRLKFIDLFSIHYFGIPDQGINAYQYHYHYYKDDRHREKPQVMLRGAIRCMHPTLKRGHQINGARSTPAAS